MSFFGLLGGQKGQINERIMKVGNYVDYEWVSLVVKHEAKKKLLVTTLSKAAAVRSHGLTMYWNFFFLGISIFFYIFAIFISSIRIKCFIKIS